MVSLGGSLGYWAQLGVKAATNHSVAFEHVVRHVTSIRDLRSDKNTAFSERYGEVFEERHGVSDKRGGG